MWRAVSRAMSWSTETPARRFDSVRAGVTPVRNRVAALAWTPALLGTPFRPVSTVVWSRYGAICESSRVVSYPGPSASGVQCFIAIPFGT